MLKRLQLRAQLNKSIRDFFAARNVMEVETPLLSQFGVTDLHVHNIPSQQRFLQTSPEYAMKRLLVEGSGDIFQICKAFRQSEVGKRHNPEFTMLEWYRLGFTHIELMREVDALLQAVLNTAPADKITYQNLFLQYLNLDPLTADPIELKTALNKNNIVVENLDLISTRDAILDLLMTHCIEPHLGLEKPIFIYDYPATQAALAKIRGNVAERFEAYYQGYELANGFHELTDAAEQLKRFENDNKKRTEAGLNTMAIDNNLITALEQGLPECAGVAMGLDRLLMIKMRTDKIRDVLSFDWLSC